MRLTDEVRAVGCAKRSAFKGRLEKLANTWIGFLRYTCRHIKLDLKLCLENRAIPDCLLSIQNMVPEAVSGHG